jgi:TonB family protein
VTRIALSALGLLLLAPLGGHAEPAAGVELQLASLAGKSVSGARVGPPHPGAEARNEFERTMAEITADLPDLVVTSKARSDADQERLWRQGYAPHRHSQHRVGLAWDVVASPQVLELVAERARENGFTALPMRSPVSGRSYLHVQRYARSPLRMRASASFDEPRDTEADAPPGESGAATGHAHAPQPEPEVEVATGTDAAAVAAPLAVPRPIGVTGFEFPRRLLARKARGTIVLLVELNADGDVEELQIDSSDLPAFERFVTREVKRWKFTPFMREGQAVAATARLPIPIHIN